MLLLELFNVSRNEIRLFIVYRLLRFILFVLSLLGFLRIKGVFALVQRLRSLLIELDVCVGNW